MQNLNLKDANVKYIENFLSKNDADRLYESFKKLPYQRRIVEYNLGKGKLNRATVAFSDKNIKNIPDIWGKDIPVLDWTPEMIEIKEKIKKVINQSNENIYNVCLCNYYSTGNRTIGWHSDREEYGSTQSIASISLGDERSFMFRKKGKQESCLELTLNHGSLLWMGPGTQENYEHCVPKEQNKKCNGRINLTFRIFHQENYAKTYL